MDTIKTRIEQLAKKHGPAMIALGRKLHQHPETALEEFQTQKTIAAKLKEAGCKVNTRIWKTAVVGLLQGKHKGKTVGIRSDMDALPVTEKTGYSFASRNKGKMHACGHDVHVSLVCGAAKILSELRHQMHGNVKFIYQPSEEMTPGGAKFLIRKGISAREIKAKPKTTAPAITHLLNLNMIAPSLKMLLFRSLRRPIHNV